MKLNFTKGLGKFDVLELQRPGVAPQRIECPKQRIIPHDMVHYAVEHTLAARGFLGRIKDGEAASFQMHSQAQSDGVERLVEVIQGDAWSGASASAQDLIAMYHLTCEARGCPPLAVDAAALNAVRAAMAELTQAWDAVPVGGVLALEL
ncbi:hypothetical protein ACG0Z6_11205 [Roseateles sp. BYS180W]|uniref:Uncharacterized protein n=1 Tax=Roseateles rivi TaxID=3299028 RepID=A0ABW7FWX0_9BURK